MKKMRISHAYFTRSALVVIGISALVQCCSAFTSTPHHGSVRTSKVPFAAQSALISSTSKPSDSDPVFDTIMRFELKQELLDCADEFQHLQQEMFAAKATEEASNKSRRNWFRRGNSKSDPIGGAFGAQSFASIQIDLGEKGEEVIALAERLSELTMIAQPTSGWMGYNDGSPEDCALDGKWKLRFTSGADATFPESSKRGKAITSQIVNATEGTLTNAVDFEKGKIKGFRVIVEGTAVSDTDMNLNFKKVVIQRDSRFPRLFERISILLPSFRFLSAFARFASKGKSAPPRPSGPGFTIKYMDNDLRMHKTRDGIWFIQTRIVE